MAENIYNDEEPEIKLEVVPSWTLRIIRLLWMKN